jgi:hypothetical protein
MKSTYLRKTDEEAKYIWSDRANGALSFGIWYYLNDQAVLIKIDRKDIPPSVFLMDRSKAPRRSNKLG